MKTVGIIGGFGPETSAQFQLKVISLFNQASPNVRPSIIMFNPPISRKIERTLILEGVGLNQILPNLKNSAQILERAGADFIVLPCNTLHTLSDHIQGSIKVPLLNIVVESIHAISKLKIKKIAILGTGLTIRSKMHAKLLHRQSIKTIFPNRGEQRKLNQIIHDIVSQKSLEKCEQDLSCLLHDLAPRCNNNFLLACTDLQLVCRSSDKFKIIDSTEILAIATVNKLLEANNQSVTITKGE